MRPGPNTTSSSAIPTSSSPTETGTWFVAGLAAQGPTVPTLITSFAQYQKVFGARGTSYQLLSDSVETFFLEGGKRVYVCRAVGPAAVVASAKLKHTATESLEIKANGAGLWGNNLSVVVAEASGTFTITVKLSGETVETSPSLSNVTEAVNWAKSSQYIRAVATGTENPSAAATALASGADDNTNVTVTQYEACLKQFAAELGPGQLSVPGITATTTIEALFKVAKEQKRRAVADLPNGASKSSLVTAATTIRGLASAGYGALFASWQSVAALPGVVGTRSVPPSPFVAATAADVDSRGNPNLPLAGKQAILYNSLGQETSFTEAEVEELYNAGVNVSKVVGGQVRLYGNRTPANPQTEPLLLQFSNVRLDMAVTWKALAIEETFMFTQLDGQGVDLGEYGNALKAMLLDLYKEGALFGATPQAAYTVDTGEDVNSPASEAEGNANATIAMRRSPGADQINLSIVRVPITQEV